FDALRWVLPHPGPVEVIGFSADGKMVLTQCHVRSSAGDQHDELRLLDEETGKLLGEPIILKASIIQAALSPDGRVVIFAGADGLAHLWDVKADRAIGAPLRH